jgi:hypothetical protein
VLWQRFVADSGGRGSPPERERDRDSIDIQVDNDIHVVMLAAMHASALGM